MSRTTTRVAQVFFSSSRRFNNAGVKSAGVLPPVSPHKFPEHLRIRQVPWAKEGDAK